MPNLKCKVERPPKRKPRNKKSDFNILKQFLYNGCDYRDEWRIIYSNLDDKDRLSLYFSFMDKKHRRITDFCNLCFTADMCTYPLYCSSNYTKISAYMHLCKYCWFKHLDENTKCTGETLYKAKKRGYKVAGYKVTFTHSCKYCFKNSPYIHSKQTPSHIIMERLKPDLKLLSPSKIHKFIYDREEP